MNGIEGKVVVVTGGSSGLGEATAKLLAGRGAKIMLGARREEARSVRSALDTLPEDQRRAIELAYFGGFSHSQIAELLGEPIGTVKGRMRLGLDKLRRQLADGFAQGELA